MVDILPTVASDQGFIEPTPVVLVAQDGTALIPGVAVGPTTASVTSITAATTTTTINGVNAARKGLTVFNDSTAIMYLKMGASASTTSYTLQLASNGYWEMPFGYTGSLTAVWASAVGSARVTTLA